MERYVCIHGHFYQPPRENPSLEAVEIQDSAYPYHDWNERITAECYGPNGTSRILDGDGRIQRIVNNYARMSFNFGPTLLSWLEIKAPDVYQSILAADRESAELFSGHGSALAQAYNHVILPLASSRDRRTQLIWGIRDFERRFGRQPEGMWLPETAVDLESLDLLTEFGVKFTILAQHQASRVRRIGASSWRDVSGGRIDPTRAYQLRLPSNRTINLFFYDGPVSRAVAFEGLLNSGERLADRIVGGFSESRSWPQLMHIATDGESYGHHHRHGDMALAYALHRIESSGNARLTNYGEFLEKYPPTHEVSIFQNTSWSCAHGIERWKSNCGCNSGSHPGWSQEWRGPLREALDWLRDNLAPEYEKRAGRLLRDPWDVRDGYISVMTDRSPDAVDQFLGRHATRALSSADKVRVLKLLELQRHALLMYTSCGWFFDDISGIETVQVLQYAGRAIQLARELFGNWTERRFLELLERAGSNLAEHRDGRRIYEKWVKSGLVDLHQVGAHYAISSLFEEYGDHASLHCYTVDRRDHTMLSTGSVRLALGRALVTSQITRESRDFNFGVLHLGDYNLSGGVREYRNGHEFEDVSRTLEEAFKRGDLTELIRVVDRSFGANSYSLRLLFRDQQRKVLGSILDSALADAEAIYSQVYEKHAPLMRLLAELDAPPPKAWQAAAELVINGRLRKHFGEEKLDLAAIASLLGEARGWRITLDEAGLGYALRGALERVVAELVAKPEDTSLLDAVEKALDLARSLPFQVDLRVVQNGYYDILQTLPVRLQQRAQRYGQATREWLEQFARVGEKLGVRVTDVVESQLTAAASLSATVESAMNERRVPQATYRLQFNSDFTFAEAKALVPYLHALGISDCYSSPLLKARANSTHGYDTCDHSLLNPDLGGDDGFEAFSGALREAEMGLILDIVPNHMGIADSSNGWWMDVLENGPSSIYSRHFDIDWQPVKPELQNKVLLPILEDQYGKVLESGKLRLAYEDGAFFIYHYQTRLPVAPRSYRDILAYQIDTLAHALGENHEHVRELQSILTALSYLPIPSEVNPDRVAERNREKEIIKARISALYEASAYFRAAIDTALQAFNGEVGVPSSFDLLDRLLTVQSFRPAFWRVAGEEINYRRFFDINDLAAIRPELPEVFDSIHAVVLRLLSEGKATGLRVDHADGLWNPRDYLRQLQEDFLVRRLLRLVGDGYSREDIASVVAARFGGLPASGRTASSPLYVVAEKILSEGEALREDWPVEGTTGYDFLNQVNGLFVDSGSRKAFDRAYSQFIGKESDYHNLASSSKKMIMLVSQAGEINALTHHLERIAEKSRLYRDFTLNSFTFAMREVIAALPVYRTYVTGLDGVGTQDEQCVELAVAEAKRRNPRTAVAIFDFLRDTLLLRNLGDFPPEDQDALVQVVMKFQQITGPVMAKGVEDTAFYVYNRLVSLNEVGGQPDRFGNSVASFHHQNVERRTRWPHAMLATSTHDTKRSEDVRARINVLSEMPEEWSAAIGRWAKTNRRRKTIVDGAPAPDPNDEYLLYQTLLGVWPDPPTGGQEMSGFHERIASYMLKATKEAKVHTSWVNANDEYDAAVRDFARGILSSPGNDPFLIDFLALQRKVAYYGRFNSLSQLLLKLTCPGVPDIYRGTELWDFSLVDPDNRRPVDFRRRMALLAEIRDRLAANMGRRSTRLSDYVAELLEHSQDGRIKLYVMHKTLRYRREHERLFSEGGYVPLACRGEKKDHVIAFARIDGDDAALVIVPRLVVRLTGGAQCPPTGASVWGDTRLILPRGMAGKSFHNLFTDEAVDVDGHGGEKCLPIASVCSHFPEALLHSG